MTDTQISTQAPSVLPRRPVRRLPVVGACLGMASLVAAMIAGHDGSSRPAVALAAGAVAVLGAELLRRVLSAVRTPDGPLLALIALTVVATILAVSVLGATFNAVATAGLALIGTLLATYGLAEAKALRTATPTPWGALRGVTLHDRSRLLLGAAGPGLSGVILMLTSLRGDQTTRAAFVILATSVALVVRHAARTRAASALDPAAGPPDDVAAHLHDSVLQTLALIQRSADDPAKVAQLARQQERSLRDWLAGRSGGHATTVPAALHAAAAEVEDEIAGTTIDVVCVGQTPIDRRSEMLVQAAREAMRNAARHGSPKVRVFAETDTAGTRIFIRDTGDGFSIDTVPADRRGVRDAIIGRMDHVDGTVEIDSGDHGTEIELYLPARPTSW